MIWLALAVCTAVALALLLTPLLRRPAQAAMRAEYDIKIYRDQLSELERDAARGMIGAHDAAAARTEIERKILAADAGRGETDSGSTSRRTAVATAMALGIAAPAMALGLYAYLGSPALPDQPLASRSEETRIAGEQENDLRAVVAELGLRIQDNPSDLDAWLQLGNVLFALGRDDDAVEAFNWAVEVSGGDPDVRSRYGEALVRASNGSVTEEAAKIFAAVVAEAPSEPRSRYYLALGDYQAGKLEPALAMWQALAEDAPADAPWKAAVVARIREVAEELGRDPEALVPAGPDGDDIAAAQAMSREEQQAMIRSMVDGLAQRLEGAPEDVDGWLQLARSYTVLGEQDKAINAFARAAEQAPDRLDVLEGYALAALAPVDNGAPLPPRVIEIMRDILVLAPDHPDALWFLGLAAAQDGHADDAIASFERLLAVLPAESDRRELVSREIDALRQNR